MIIHLLAHAPPPVAEPAAWVLPVVLGALLLTIIIAIVVGGTASKGNRNQWS